MTEKLKELIHDKKVLILGFGREGQSSYELFRSILPEKTITVADKNKNLQSLQDAALKDKSLELKLGSNYCDELENFNLIIKSPGIKLDRKDLKTGTILTSQTQLFLEHFAQQVVGVTGTKGKSTTASLLHHILSEAGKDVLLIGNIGIPPLSTIQNITKKSIIVFELSAHQLEDISISPKISIFLNIFQEHLDHFKSLKKYLNAKANIFSHAKPGYQIILNYDQPELKLLASKVDQISTSGFSIKDHRKAQCFLRDGAIHSSLGGTISEIIQTSEIKTLIGNHNLYNIMATLLACQQLGISKEEFTTGLQSFKSLEHRLEYVGEYKRIHFYNDSISTVPESTIAAVKSLLDTDTIILGGFDRGINYDALIHFLTGSKIKNLIFMGAAGKRMNSILEETDTSSKRIFDAPNLDEAMKFAFAHTEAGKICLLSPAASSYDQFKDFEERGLAYKKMARNS